MSWVPYKFYRYCLKCIQGDEYWLMWQTDPEQAHCSVGSIVLKFIQISKREMVQRGVQDVVLQKWLACGFFQTHSHRCPKRETSFYTDSILTPQVVFFLSHLRSSLLSPGKWFISVSQSVTLSTASTIRWCTIRGGHSDSDHRFIQLYKRLLESHWFLTKAIMKIKLSFVFLHL